MLEVTWWTALIGGGLIGVAASLLLVLNGRIAGVSGMIGRLVLPVGTDHGASALFLGGLVLSGAIAALAFPDAIGASPRGMLGLAVAGLLVGVGTRLGNGCTSGHGVCGLSRLSTRSLVATGAFMASGVLTVAVVRALGGAL